MKKESKLEKKTKPIRLPNTINRINISAVAIAFLILYGLGCLHSGGDANPFKWGEIQERIHLIQQQNYYHQQFHELDKNKDYVIDSTEFIYRK